MGEIIQDLRDKKSRLQQQKAYLQDAPNQITILNQRIAKINAIIDAIQGIDT